MSRHLVELTSNEGVRYVDLSDEAYNFLNWLYRYDYLAKGIFADELEEPPTFQRFDAEEE